MGDEAEGQLPFRAEYAKSGRAGCKGCKTNIPQGSLRLAVMIQSPFFDGKQPNWHHEQCFFLKQRPKSIADIAKFTSLRYEDQERVKNKIESFSGGMVMAAETKGKKGKKRANVDAASSAALKDFEIEYSKSSRATCRVCEIKITKGEVRISKKVFDTEIGQKYGGQALWHHVKCFAGNRAELLFFAGGEMLPGFNSLTKEDKVMVKTEIPALKNDEIPVKKIKNEPEEVKNETKENNKEEEIIKVQSKLTFKFRDKLEKNFSKAQLQELLEFNEQVVPPGIDRILDRLADCLAFGRLMPCNVCKEGQLVLDTNGYKCYGHLTGWTACQAMTQNPDRKAFKIPASLKGISPLNSYKYKPKTRVFRKLLPTTTLVKIETEKQKLQPIPPLKNLEFFIYGLGKKSKDDIKIKILKMGGKVVTKITDSTAAVISTPYDVEHMPEKMLEIQNKDIQVVDTNYINELKPTMNVAESISLITEKNIASWGSDPKKRIPQDVVDGKSIPKSVSSIYSKSMSGITKLKLKGGTAVDPDSELDDVAHVYKSSKGLKYSVVLGLTDIVSKKNSYYKLQLLEADKKNKYWLFRSWGRIGTTIGGNKTEKCDSLSAAKTLFENLFMEKTDNVWGVSTDDFEKQPGKMYPIEIDYGEDENKIRDLSVDTSDCKLPVPVQHLIKMIFDVESMKKVMLEFELDLEKMPLGKLSKKQLTRGYEVLTKLQQTLLDMKISDNKSSQAKIVDFTNRFYTLIPHSFGIENPPLLDSDESIKKKTEMLDNLLEMEIAYSIMKSDGKNQTGSPLDSHYIQLKSEIHPIYTESPEFDLIKRYVENTHASTHNMYDLEILQMFKVERQGEDKQFKPFRKLPNRRLLWHGSRVTNFAGILSQGLRIAPPEAPVTGYMFGKGIYFADMVSKSANYCCTDVKNSTGLMLLCEVALGNMHELTNAEYVTNLPPGKQSVKGIGKTEPNPDHDVVLDCGTIVPLGKPVQKKIPSSLLYNEFIVYDVAQVKVKYLFQMKFNYKF